MEFKNIICYVLFYLFNPIMLMIYLGLALGIEFLYYGALPDKNIMMGWIETVGVVTDASWTLVHQDGGANYLVTVHYQYNGNLSMTTINGTDVYHMIGGRSCRFGYNGKDQSMATGYIIGHGRVGQKSQLFFIAD